MQQQSLEGKFRGNRDTVLFTFFFFLKILIIWQHKEWAAADAEGEADSLLNREPNWAESQDSRTKMWAKGGT